MSYFLLFAKVCLNKISLYSLFSVLGGGGFSVLQSLSGHENVLILEEPALIYKVKVIKKCTFEKDLK